MMCPHPDCTSCHDNNRYSELCPKSLAAKQIKDRSYSLNHPDKIYMKGVGRRADARTRQLEELLGAEFVTGLRNADILLEIANS